ncbi:MAG: hypothetical protein E7056_02235 [Lentisphaerae bacterium]|nr:hypothetical protein [Lentisphaerota bacterium]
MKNNKITVSRKLHYTIVEMMMVIAVFMIILAMAMVAWLNSGNQAQLRNAVRLVSKELSLARAKAISEHKSVGVCFNIDTASKIENFAMIICQEGQKDKVMPGEHWVKLPGQIVFTCKDPATDQSVKWITGGQGKIVFKADGSLSADTDDALETFYLVAGDQKTGKIAEDEPYYKLVLNTFTGHTIITFHEE